MKSTCLRRIEKMVKVISWLLGLATMLCMGMQVIA